MSLRLRSAIPLAAASLLVSAGTTEGAFFSFASDSGPSGSNAWTFAGSAGSNGAFSLRQGGTASDAGGVGVTLKIDDNQGGLPVATLNVGFTANLRATRVPSSPVGAVTLHNYAVTGSFSFVDRANGTPLITATIGGGATPGPQSALLVVPGQADRWGTAGAVLASDSLAGDTAARYTFTPALFALAASQGVNLANYGVVPGSSINGDDFAFDLSFINAGERPVQLDATTGLPVTAFNAESSFSATVLQIVPAPGAAGMFAFVGLLLGRHRRR